jgi:hypothetical protein
MCSSSRLCISSASLCVRLGGFSNGFRVSTPPPPAAAPAQSPEIHNPIAHAVGAVDQVEGQPGPRARARPPACDRRAPAPGRGGSQPGPDARRTGRTVAGRLCHPPPRHPVFRKEQQAARQRSRHRNAQMAGSKLRQRHRAGARCASDLFALAAPGSKRDLRSRSNVWSASNCGAVASSAVRTCPTSHARGFTAVRRWR